MKRLLTLSSIAAIVLLSAFQVSFSSCTKEILKFDTVIITKKDTIIIKDSTISLQLMVANAWKIQEIKGVLGGVFINYLRGGTNNNVNYDIEYIIYRSDKTGTYYDANGYPSSLTWDFGNAENTKIVYTVNFPTPGPTVVTWDNLRYKNGALKYDQYWTQGGLNSHTQNIRIPR